MGLLSGYSVSSVKIILLSLFFLTVTKTFSQNGELLFTQNCTACHTIGGGPLVGPDLKGVSEKYEESWLLKFIQSSQTMVKAGDEQAVATFQQYNMVPMVIFLLKLMKLKQYWTI
ncbi:cytochrome c [uncultured Imperialibacter sp.]|uniref:cytochrome c n=1 Tax=Imperialibacter sp. TaxID=2038411 RepID=UPI0030D83200|tara:strand:- start:1634 stop:1978 length:345 start_codon:yes stop_codon:yes gene_type:complete